MKWIRPLHDEQATEKDSELITPISQIVNTHGFHPFYRSLVEENITRLKGVGRELKIAAFSRTLSVKSTISHYAVFVRVLIGPSSVPRLRSKETSALKL